MSSSEDDDGAFDAFLASLKPAKKEKYRLSSGSINDFVVDDSHVSFKDSSSSDEKSNEETIEEHSDEINSPVSRRDRNHPKDSDKKQSDRCNSGNVSENERSVFVLHPPNNISSHCNPDRQTDSDVDDSDQHSNGTTTHRGHDTRWCDTKQKTATSPEMKSVQRKIVFSTKKGKKYRNFTPKRSTASKNSVTKKGLYSTPRLIFSSDSDSEEERKREPRNFGKNQVIKDLGKEYDNNLLASDEDKHFPNCGIVNLETRKKSNDNECIGKKDVINLLTSDDESDTAQNSRKQHHRPERNERNPDKSIETLCSDFENFDLIPKTSVPTDSDCENPMTIRPRISSDSPLNSVRRGSRLLTFSDDSDNDVICLESGSDKENVEKITTDGYFLLSDEAESIDDNVFLTPKVIRKRHPLKTSTPSQFVNSSLFKTPDSIQKRTTVLKNGLPPNLPRNCGEGYGFKRNRDIVTKSLYEYFNTTVFGEKLPKDIVEWDNRLLKTAGVTKCTVRMTSSLNDGITCISRVYTARIRLSIKVLDSLHRLRDTLCHEMCHAAVWLIDNHNEGHGPFWKGWARKAMAAHPDMPVVTRCHNYDISYKFQYQCTMCRKVYGRHSKSIKVDKQVCGICKGKLVLLPPKNVDGTPAKNRQPNKFAMFVKENYKSTQMSSSIGGITPKHSDVMKALSHQYATLSTKK